MKDVVRCDKLRGGANSRRSVDFRMGQPTFDILKFAPVRKLGWGFQGVTRRYFILNT